MRKYSLFFVVLFSVLLLCACAATDGSIPVTKDQIPTAETTESTASEGATEYMQPSAEPPTGSPVEPDAPTRSDPGTETFPVTTAPKQEDVKPGKSEGPETPATQPSQVPTKPNVEETLPVEGETAPAEFSPESPVWITYEEFMSMTGQQQMEYWYSFKDPMDYIEWYQTVIGGHDQENQPDEGEGNEGFITQPTEE